jgi:hypothetical protein
VIGMGELPLNDPRWLPMKVAIDLRERQTGDRQRAVLDLEHYMVNDKLPCMRCSQTSEECELVPATDWKTQVIDITLPSEITFYRRTAVDDTPQRWGMFAHQNADRIDGWYFYVWKPDFDRLNSVGNTQAEHDKEPILPGDRATAALRALYRTKADVPGSLRVITRAVDKWCKDQGWHVVASTDTVHRAAEKLGYRAPRKARPSRKGK